MKILVSERWTLFLKASFRYPFPSLLVFLLQNKILLFLFDGVHNADSTTVLSTFKAFAFMGNIHEHQSAVFILFFGKIISRLDLIPLVFHIQHQFVFFFSK